jgi:Fe-S cluster biogenesis protein NfuA
MAEPLPHLDDAAVGQLLDRFDELLDVVEQVPGATSEAAVEAVRTLAEIYGEALRRVLTVAPDALRDELARDQLVAHLMVVHDIHPDPVQDRVEQALDAVRPYIESHGGHVDLVDIDAGVARVRLSGSCGSCSSSAVTLEQTVSEAVLALAPELTDVEPIQPPRSTTAVIPVAALFQRPPGVLGTAGAARGSA